uniref:hypothetical protein n=1 Tax=Nocardiopsis synnemataformans TaxID=61305 RepID=UPI003EBCACD6
HMDIDRTPTGWTLNLTNDELHLLVRTMHSAHIRWGEQEGESLDRPRVEEAAKLIHAHPDYRPE